MLSFKTINKAEFHIQEPKNILNISFPKYSTKDGAISTYRYFISYLFVHEYIVEITAGGYPMLSNMQRCRYTLRK